MKRNVKLLDGTIQTLDIRLGSGFLDNTGREIFEGDRVKFRSGRGRTKTGRIVFEDGMFICVDEKTCDCHCLAMIYPNDYVEVIGQVKFVS